jgi:hypothetical protein
LAAFLGAFFVAFLADFLVAMLFSTFPKNIKWNPLHTRTKHFPNARKHHHPEPQENV